MPSQSPYLGDCGYALQQALAIPTSPELLYVLNPEDIVYSDENADASLSIKYERFTRNLSAVFKTFDITLYSLPASEVNQIAAFANSDFLSNVLTNGRGSLTVFFAGNQLNNCYIQGPIQKGKSQYKNWEDPPTEVFDSIQFKVIHPEVSWY